MNKHNLTMELSDDIANKLIPFFNIELEIMQGEKLKLENGNTLYKLSIEDEQKGELIESFILKVMANTPQKQCLN